MLHYKCAVFQPLFGVSSGDRLKTVLAVLTFEANSFFVTDVLVECLRVNTRKVALWKLLDMDELLLVLRSVSSY